jgi:hypothetical protein
MSSRFVAGLCKSWVWVLLIGIAATGWSGQAKAEVGPDCPWVENWDDRDGLKWAGIWRLKLGEKRFSIRTKAMANMAAACGAPKQAAVLQDARKGMRTYQALRYLAVLLISGEVYINNHKSEFPNYQEWGGSQWGWMGTWGGAGGFIVLLAPSEISPHSDAAKAAGKLQRSFRNFQIGARAEQAIAKRRLDTCINEAGTANIFFETVSAQASARACKDLRETSTTGKPWLTEIVTQADNIGRREIEHVLHYVQSEFSSHSTECRKQNPTQFGNINPESIKETLAQSVQCKQALDSFIEWDNWGGFSSAEAIQPDLEAARTAISALKESTAPFQGKIQILENRAKSEETLLACQTAGGVVLPSDGRDSPDPGAKEWENFFNSCSAAVESWQSDWPEAERDELNDWIQTGREKQAVLLVEKEAREAAEKALLEKQEAEEKARKKKADAEAKQRMKKYERERAREMKQYHSECTQKCKTLGRRTWVCEQGEPLSRAFQHLNLGLSRAGERAQGKSVTANSHRYRRGGKMESVFFQSRKAGWDIKCHCVPADKSLPYGCETWNYGDGFPFPN